MSKQRCDHPDCKGNSKTYARLKQHKAIAHEGRVIGGKGAPKGKGKGYATPLRGELGRILDLGDETKGNDPRKATFLYKLYIKSEKSPRMKKRYASIGGNVVGWEVPTEEDLQ